jgi:hypothetical protein
MILWFRASFTRTNVVAAVRGPPQKEVPYSASIGNKKNALCSGFVVLR